MQLDFSQFSPRETYQWMIHTILPRPIAWVSTVDADGRSNLAPFSFFQGIAANPPTLMFVPVNDRHGTKKDTVRNIEAVPEFVINVVTRALAEQMNRTSATVPYGEGEMEKFGIEPAPAVRVRPRRVAAAPVAFECLLDRIINIGEGPLAANVGVWPHRAGSRPGRRDCAERLPGSDASGPGGADGRRRLRHHA